jgi:hypothetical protein
MFPLSSTARLIVAGVYAADTGVVIPPTGQADNTDNAFRPKLNGVMVYSAIERVFDMDSRPRITDLASLHSNLFDIVPTQQWPMRSSMAKQTSRRTNRTSDRCDDGDEASQAKLR